MTPVITGAGLDYEEREAGLPFLQSPDARAGVEDGVMSKPESATLKPGDRAPLFTLPNQKGVAVSLEAALAKGPVLLGFHRGTW
jgi:hypothetical protein